MRRPRTVLLALCLAAVMPAAFAAGGDKPAVPPSTAAFLGQVDAHFASWDADRDGALSRAELDAAVGDAKRTGPEAAAVAALKIAAKSKKYRLPSPLTVDAIRGLLNGTPAPSAAEPRPPLGAMYAAALGRIERAGGGKAGLFPAGGAAAAPSLDGFRQGKLGDCFCLAPLGALLHRDPKAVAGLFEKQADGTYKVTLGQQSVCVAPPTDAEIAISATAGKPGGIWVNVYEKAVGAVRVARSAGRRSVPVAVAPTGDGEAAPQDADTSVPTSPLDAINRGGSAGTMLSALTGHKIERFSCRPFRDAKTSPERREELLKDLRARLTAAFAANRLVTCGTQKPTTPGLTPNHAYAVFGYDPATDALRVWNPHGQRFAPKGTPGPETGYPTEGGVFTIPLADFVTQFTGLAFETDEPTRTPAAP
jgi:hypothetical protein